MSKAEEFHETCSQIKRSDLSQQKNKTNEILTVHGRLSSYVCWRVSAPWLLDLPSPAARQVASPYKSLPNSGLTNYLTGQLMS